jgi:hypothetical protein
LEGVVVADDGGGKPAEADEQGDAADEADAAGPAPDTGHRTPDTTTWPDPLGSLR